MADDVIFRPTPGRQSRHSRALAYREKAIAESRARGHAETRASGEEREWPLPAVYESRLPGTGLSTAGDKLTLQGELDKLAANVGIARNMAGVHDYTDYFESVRQGERVAVSLLEEQIGLYNEPVSMRFTSFDGDHVRLSGDGDVHIAVWDEEGDRVAVHDWYHRYGG